MIGADAIDLDRTIEQLSRSERGRSAIRHVLTWLDDDGLGLDEPNQDAILILIGVAWRWPTSARDAMRETIANLSSEQP
jgi:hypothetical protein